MQTQKPGRRPRPLLKKAVRFVVGLACFGGIVSGIYGSYLYADYLQMKRTSAELPGLQLSPVQESHATNAYSWYASYPQLNEPVFDRTISKLVNDIKAAFLARVDFQATTSHPLDDLNVSFELGTYNNRTLSVAIVKRQSLKGAHTHSLTRITYDRVSKKVISTRTEKQRPVDETVAMPEKASTEPGLNCRAQKCVALTFNDGPNFVTPRILNTLKLYKAKATFFEIGAQAKLYPTIAKRTAAEGHAIGTLGENHQNLLAIPQVDAVADLAKSTNSIGKASGVRPVIARAPYAAMTQELAKRLSMPFIGWNIGDDSETNDAQSVYENVMSKVHAGAVVMNRDTRESAADAYTRIVPDLIRQGYRLVTVPELKGGLEPGLYDGD
jgi:peptidoglycan/xylan/chitin deacetylase (PgdA/CDA1 family)